MSSLHIKTAHRLFPTAPDLYGLFFEDISRAGDGGLYPEMLRNRSFEDSLLPEGCVTHDGGRTFVSPTGWVEEFNNGEGMHQWVRDNGVQPTPVPAWYAQDAQITLEQTRTLNQRRKAALRVDFMPGGRVWNIGYHGVPQERGQQYALYFFARAEQPVTLTVRIEESGRVSDARDITVSSPDYARYDAVFTASFTTENAVLSIVCQGGGTVIFGFASLMPKETFMGHGLRTDLAEKLRGMRPSFLRFPGGCIVEGFTKETAWRFQNTVGDAWERPSHWLVWHYRATNGLGFHEYLQLCEDLNIAPLYVCNCGMTCQGRSPVLFDEHEQQEMLCDILGALEYALGAPDTKWGALRAKMGHALPFRMEYLEIGNENHGADYAQRYEFVRRAVLERYPNIKIIANERGKSAPLACDIADDHYYNMPEFFAECFDYYGRYDRSKPQVFVGEFAVNQTYEGQLRAAVSEAMFMVGMERNQDIVKLSSYAPLFQHVHYGSWYPNLIIFNNRRSYAIPSYYCWRLFGGHRGDYVLETAERADTLYPDMRGAPALSGDYGVRYRDIRYNGRPAAPARCLLGEAVTQNGETILLQSGAHTLEHPVPFPVYPMVTLDEDISRSEGTLSCEAFAEPGKAIALGILCAPKPLSYYDRHMPTPADPWSPRFLEVLRWVVKDGESYVVRGGLEMWPYGEKTRVDIAIHAFHRFAYTVHGHEVDLFIDGTLVQTVTLPHSQSMCAVATDTEKEIIIKIVNFSSVPDDVAIALDCDVCESFEVARMHGGAADENSLDAPERVRDETLCEGGAGRQFVYRAPALSVNVLTLKKK